MESLLLNLQPAIKVGHQLFQINPYPHTSHFILAACLFSYDTNIQDIKQGHMQNRPLTSCADVLLCSRSALQGSMGSSLTFPTSCQHLPSRSNVLLPETKTPLLQASQSTQTFSLTHLQIFERDINYYHHPNLYSFIVYKSRHP